MTQKGSYNYTQKLYFYDIFYYKYLNEYYNQNICMVLKGPYLVQLLLVLYVHACMPSCGCVFEVKFHVFWTVLLFVI